MKLERGSTDRDEVVRLQADLQLLNYYKGGLTGQFDSVLEAAVKSFQLDHGLTADGVVGLEGPTRAKIDYAIDTAFAVTPGKLEEEANHRQEVANSEHPIGKPGEIKPVYWSDHPFHPRFDHLLPKPFTHLHPIDVARSKAGEKEIPGKKDNPFIAHTHEHCANLGKHTDGAKYSDEVPNCSSGVNWSCDGGGCKKTNNALAASHDKYPGQALKYGDYVPEGALVRIAHPGGHITFANKKFRWIKDETFEGYGFNQGNTAKTSIYSTNHIVSIHIVGPLPGTVLAPIGILGTKPIPATGQQGESTR